MKKVLFGSMLLACAIFFLNVAWAADTKAPASKAKETPKACYACDKCCDLAMAPGKCAKCGGEMTQKHLVALKDGSAYLCGCGADCKCTMKADDPAKCSCGKPMTKVSLKGKYVCGCGPDCKCNEVSDKPGKCGCGKDLVEVK